jgi:hypothetical protein
VLWGRLSLWKWLPVISLGVKAAGAYGWWPTKLVVPNIIYMYINKGNICIQIKNICI